MVPMRMAAVTTTMRVATLIGYASRKLGRYDDAKYWYDKALAADPNHAVTWSY
jgi:tetratricopeptide (TPR) repeat protein